jgi:hypothetical protein
MVKLVANLTLPGSFAYNSNGMQPLDPSFQNSQRTFGIYAGQVTIVIS